MSKTLFIVRGVNNEGAWTQYVLAESPGEALDAATKRKPWNILDPLEVEMPIDFFDATEIEDRSSHGE